MISLPLIDKHRHKYTSGYVVALSGSTHLTGAPKLAALAAMKAGSGIVRIFYESSIGETPLEIISQPWVLDDWKEALLKATAVFIGPGLGRSLKALKMIEESLDNLQIPCVIDADALLPHLIFPKKAILTPHRGEMLRLLDEKSDLPDDLLFSKTSQFCQQRGVIVVLKGAPTRIFSDLNAPVIISRGDPGMAKAGTGDVLTGIIASLLSQKMDPFNAAVLGVTIHAMAGEEAVKETTSYCMLASDIIRYLPTVFKALMG